VQNQLHMKKILFTALCLLVTTVLAHDSLVLRGQSQALHPDPNFYIFLSFGQSNMEGGGSIEEQDRLSVFIDPEGYKKYVEDREETFKKELAKQKAPPAVIDFRSENLCAKGAAEDGRAPTEERSRFHLVIQN
jgi:hypothetical protein